MTQQPGLQPFGFPPEHHHGSLHPALPSAQALVGPMCGAGPVWGISPTGLPFAGPARAHPPAARVPKGSGL